MYAIYQLSNILTSNLSVLGVSIISPTIDKQCLNIIISAYTQNPKVNISHYIICHQNNQQLSEIKAYQIDNLAALPPVKISTIQHNFFINYHYTIPISIDETKLDDSFMALKNKIEIVIRGNNKVVIKPKGKNNTKKDDISIYASSQPVVSNKSIEGNIIGNVWLMNGMTDEEIKVIIIEDLKKSVLKRIRYSETMHLSILAKRVFFKADSMNCEFCGYILPYEEPEEIIPAIENVIGEKAFVSANESIKLKKEKKEPVIVQNIEKQNEKKIQAAKSKEKRCSKLLVIGFIICIVALILQISCDRLLITNR